MYHEYLRVFRWHTEITEHTELRFALLSLHPVGKFTLIIFDLTQRRKEAQKLLRMVTPLIFHLSSLIVQRSPQNLRTSERDVPLISHLSTLIVQRSPQNFRTSERDISSELSSLIVQRSSFSFPLHSFQLWIKLTIPPHIRNKKTQASVLHVCSPNLLRSHFYISISRISENWFHPIVFKYAFLAPRGT